MRAAGVADPDVATELDDQEFLNNHLFALHKNHRGGGGPRDGVGPLRFRWLLRDEALNARRSIAFGRFRAARAAVYHATSRFGNGNKTGYMRLAWLRRNGAPGGADWARFDECGQGLAIAARPQSPITLPAQNFLQYRMTILSCFVCS